MKARLLLAALCLAAAGCTGSDEPTTVADVVAEHVQVDEPGVAVGVFEAGRVVHAQGYGLARLDPERANTPKTTFHLASVGKQMTAVAIMMLAHEGKLGLDEPVARHLTELARTDQRVTIRRLLHHTAALPDVYEQLGSSGEDVTNDDLLAAVAREELDTTPGDEESYSNVGYDVLGSVITRVSGQRFEDFMRDRIFAPLGMKDTFSLPNPDGLEDPDRAVGYTEGDDGFEVYDTDPLDNVQGSGSIYSSLEDLARYDAALDGDELLPREVMSQAFQRGTLNDGEEIDYGFGWELGTYEGDDYAGHSGAWVGYSTYYLRFPDERASVVVLSNREDLEAEALAFEVGDLF